MSLEQKEKEMPVKLSEFKYYIDKADKHWNWILDLGLGVWIEDIDSLSMKTYEK